MPSGVLPEFSQVVFNYAKIKFNRNLDKMERENETKWKKTLDNG